MKQEPFNVPTEWIIPSGFLYTVIGFGAIIGTRFLNLFFLKQMDEQISKSNEELEIRFDQKLDDKINPMKEDIHFIKTCLSGRDGVSLAVLDALRKFENKL